MDRGAWRATVMRWQRVGHDLATKQQKTNKVLLNYYNSVKSDPSLSYTSIFLRMQMTPHDFVAQFSNEACKMKAECEAL